MEGRTGADTGKPMRRPLPGASQQRAEPGREERCRYLDGRDQLVEMGIDEAGVEPAGTELGTADQVREKGRIGARAGDLQGFESPAQAVERRLPRRSMGDDLGDHRIVMRADDLRIHLVHPHRGVDANAFARGLEGRPVRDAALLLIDVEVVQRSGRRQKTLLRILGIEPRLDGVPVDRQLVLREAAAARRRRRAVASSTRSSPVTASVTGCSTCRRVFISMKKKPSARRPFEPSAMNSTVPAPTIADGRGRRDGGAAHGVAHGRRHARRGGLLDDLLVAALQRAVALEQMHDIAVPVAEHLHLDVARLQNVFLDEHAPVAEGVRALHARALVEGGVEIEHPVDPAHALAAAAGDRLDQDRIADLIGLLAQEIGILPVAVIAGHRRHAGPLHQRLRLALEAHGADRGWRRADEDDARGGAGLGEFRVLRQEAVAGVNRGGARALRGLDDPVDDEIALARRPAARSDTASSAIATCGAAASASE